MLDNDRAIVAVSESSSSAGLPIPAIHCLVIAAPEASSSAGSRVSAVGEGCSVTEALNASSGLTISARADSGWVWSVRSPTPCMTQFTLKISAIVASMQPVGIPIPLICSLILIIPFNLTRSAAWVPLAPETNIFAKVIFTLVESI